MISFDQVKAGYRAGFIKVVDGYPYGGDGAVCKIGDGWFYFGGLTAENMTAEEYVEAVPEADILREIYDALEDFREVGDVFDDEYNYYELYLNEVLK